MTTVIDDAARRFLSIGAVGRLVGLSPSRLRELEAAGVIPKAARLEGMDRRLYSPSDVTTIRTVLAEREAARQTRGAV